MLGCEQVFLGCIVGHVWSMVAAGFGGGGFDGNVLIRLWGVRVVLYDIDRYGDIFVKHVWWEFVSVTKPRLFHCHQLPHMVWCQPNRANSRLGTSISSVF